MPIMKIITKFTVATERGIDTLSMLTKELAMEKFSSLLEGQEIDDYIARKFTRQVLMDEVNSMSNQWLIVYADDSPAGYARITSRGKKPQVFDGKRAIRIADFGILQKYPAPAIREALLEKCITVCKSYEGVWINEYVGNPLIGFFENKGFARRQETCELDELPLASVILIA